MNYSIAHVSGPLPNIFRMIYSTKVFTSFPQYYEFPVWAIGVFLSLHFLLSNVRVFEDIMMYMSIFLEFYCGANS